MEAAEDLLIPMPDGRTVGCRVRGERGSRPLLYLHGMPGSRLEADMTLPDDLLAEHGIFLVSADRPGCGLSDPRPVEDATLGSANQIAVCDHLGIERVGLVGMSGGCLHALALVATRPARVERVVLVSMGEPLDGDSYLAGRSSGCGSPTSGSVQLSQREPTLRGSAYAWGGSSSCTSTTVRQSGGAARGGSGVSTSALPRRSAPATWSNTGLPGSECCVGLASALDAVCRTFLGGTGQRDLCAWVSSAEADDAPRRRNAKGRPLRGDRPFASAVPGSLLVGWLLCLRQDEHLAGCHGISVDHHVVEYGLGIDGDRHL